MSCKSIEPVLGCWKKADGTTETVGIHHTYQIIGKSEKLIKTRYTDAKGNGINIPNTDSISYGACCCNDVEEHYLCIDGQKIPVWVSLNPSNLEVEKVVNTLTMETVDPALYQNGFQNPCQECENICLGNCDTATCIVYKDINGELSQTTLDNIEFTFTANCPQDGTVTGLDVGNGVENLADGSNSNLESYINQNLGDLGFAAIPNIQPYGDPVSSSIKRYMELTYPTCSPWEIVIQNLPESYGGNFSGVRYTFDGTVLNVFLIDNTGNTVAIPVGGSSNISQPQSLKVGC